MLEKMILKRIEPNLAKFEAGKLQALSQGWRLCFEWDAIQPRRIRLIKPVLYVYSPVSSKLSINTKVFADSFPEPLILEASMDIEAKHSSKDLVDIFPNWEELLEKTEKEDISNTIITWPTDR
jgi:hypothetical protein